MSNTNRETEIVDAKKKKQSCSHSVGVHIYQERQDMKTYKELLENYPQGVQENSTNLSTFKRLLLLK